MQQHEDDLVDHVLAQEPREVVRFPAIAEAPPMLPMVLWHRRNSAALPETGTHDIEEGRSQNDSGLQGRKQSCRDVLF
jgi:hypothetical protein